MSDLAVALATRHYEGTMHQPGVGDTKLGFEVVTGIQLPNSSPLRFNHHLLPGTGGDVDQITLPEEMALRLSQFAQEHFVAGKGGFDCRSFLGYVMGWDTVVTPGRPRIYHGDYVSPGATKPSKPYLVAQQQGGVTSHAMLGHNRPGESLGVAGTEYPLVVAKNEPIMKAFGGVALLEVSHVQDVPQDGVSS